jgi:hypothetical protein
MDHTGLPSRCIHKRLSGHRTKSAPSSFLDVHRNPARKDITMRKLLLSGFAVVALATTALAQQPPVPPTAGEPPAAGAQSSPPPPPSAGDPDTMDEPDVGQPSDRPGSLLHDRDRYHAFGFRGHHRPPPSKAAHFWIEDGDTTIDIKCADDEPTKVCADLLLQVIEKLGTPSQR